MLNEASKTILKTAMNRLNFSVRAYKRILIVGRMISDLDGEQNIQREHVRGRYSLEVWSKRGGWGENIRCKLNLIKAKVVTLTYK